MRVITRAVIAVLLVTFAGQKARSQSEARKVELGAHLTGIDLNEVFEIPGGPGVRFAYNVNRYLAFDSELNYFPISRRSSSLFRPPESFGNFGEVELLVGLRAGARFKKYGLFAKARPGLMHFRRRQITSDFNDRSLNRFALDVGGVFEYYPTSRVILRIDMGDTIIPLGGRTIPTPDGPVHLKTGLHNFQAGFGFGIRF